MSRDARPMTALVGAGRLAVALGPLLLAAGYPVVAVASRDGRTARRLARRLGSATRATDPDAAARAARLVLLAVPDRELAPLARELARRLGRALRGKTLLHHAGALGVEPLRPLARAGAATGVLHPLQSLGTPPLVARTLPGSRARVEGDPRALRVARRLVRDLGMIPLALPGVVRAAGRARYHAAAAMASNDLLALLSLATEQLERLGLERSEALAALLPLARGTLAQAEQLGLEAALTGPVVRGDAETVEAHLAQLARVSRPAERAHRLLSERALELAVAGGRLPRARRAELRRLLRGRGPKT